MHNRFVRLFLLITTGIPVCAAAQDVEPGVQYEGEANLRFPEYGVSFVLPRGWLGVIPPDGEFFTMSSQEYEAYILCGVEEMSGEEARDVMSDAIDVGDGVVLHPTGGVREEGDVLTADYSVTGSRNPLIAQVTTLVADDARVAFLIAATAESNFAKLLGVAGQVRESIVLGEPEPTQNASSNTTASSGFWSSQIAGNKLSYFYTTTGYTEEHYLWICGDGRFYSSTNAGGFGGGASGAFESRNGGAWTASGQANRGRLILKYNDGSTTTYELTLDGNKLYLEGDRYFREPVSCG